MRRALVLAIILGAALAAGAPAAAAAPVILPAVTEVVRAARGECASVVYRAPMAGHLDVRLRGRGDWDLVLLDGAGRRLGASRGFGGREVVQAWVRASDRLVASGCRRRGATGRARIAFRLVDVALPALGSWAPRLLRVRGPRRSLLGLEIAGLDLTHARGRGWADVVVTSRQQLLAVQRAGLAVTTRTANLLESFTAHRAADRRYGARIAGAGSPLPSGRTSYRTYEDVQSELKRLVAENPGLARQVTFGRSFQGRELSGIEIARDVEAADGRPVYFVVALYHAREWPSAEAAMELAHLLVQQKADRRIGGLLDRERVVILPIANPDGFVSSRKAFDPGDALGQPPDVTFVEAIAPFGGVFAYRRKNCNGELFGPEFPCELAWGVDPNRNHGFLWGGPGSSADVTSQDYHGPGPRSEPEVRAVWDYVRKHHVTMLVSIHNVAALVLRPPGLEAQGLAPDEPALKALGDAMARAAGYESQYGFELYDTAGTADDDTYGATGGYGYTIEMGPPDGDFHGPYETSVVREWTGDNGHASGRGGLREALLIGAEAAADPAHHSVLRGAAPAGRRLRLRKAFDTVTSPYCATGIEPVLGGVPGICLSGQRPPLTLRDELDTATTTPARGVFHWHIGPSTRPFAAGKEVYTLTCETPGGAALESRPVTIDRGQTVTLDLGCGGPTRAQRLAACRKRAKRVRGAARRRAALRTCARRYGRAF